MASQDPLDLLRASVKENRPAVLLTSSGSPADTLAAAATLSFPQEGDGDAIVLPKDTPTRYARSAKRTDFYTVGQLWLAYTERDTGVREYLPKGQAAGVGYVVIPDRRGVVDYLVGVSDGAGRVVTDGEASATSAAPTEVAPAPADAGPSKLTTAVKRKYEVNVADRDFCKKLRAEEVELSDRSTVLRVSGGGKANNFQNFVQSVMTEKIRALRKSFDPSGRSVAPAAPVVQEDHSRSRKRRDPIIIISSSPTSLITMWNVKKFLEQGIFEPSEVARANEAAQNNYRAEDVVTILRKRSGAHGDITSKCYVVDSVEALQKFGQDPWDRVVCVVTTGQAWQFKPYKWMDPKVLFRNVKGIYFRYNNEPPVTAVRDWNVAEMKVDRFKRHTDRQVVAEFWRVIDTAKR